MRQDAFIGAYVPPELKESLERRASAEHRTLFGEITVILIEAVREKPCRPARLTGARPRLTLSPSCC